MNLTLLGIGSIRLTFWSWVFYKKPNMEDVTGQDKKDKNMKITM